MKKKKRLKIVPIMTFQKDEDTGLFVRHYNKYIKRNSLKHSDKNLVKFRKSNPPRK